MNWIAFDDGKTLGKQGSEDGLIIKDEELPDEARITIEQGGRIAPYSITCGLYGCMAHTCYFSSQLQAEAAMEEMKEQLSVLAVETTRQMDEDSEATTRRVGSLVSAFVERFP